MLCCISQHRANPLIILSLLSKIFLLSNVNLVAFWADSGWMVTFKISCKFSACFQVIYMLFHTPSFSRLHLFFGAILISLLTLGTALHQVLHTGTVWSKPHHVCCTISGCTLITRKYTIKTFAFMLQYLSQYAAICTARFSHLIP